MTTVVNKRLEPFDVYIGRPSEWGNPYVIGPDGTREEVIDKYERYLKIFRPDLIIRAKVELKDKRLGCFCKPLPCHGDILAEIANES